MYLNKEISITTLDLVRHRGLKSGSAPADFHGEKGTQKQSMTGRRFEAYLG